MADFPVPYTQPQVISVLSPECELRSLALGGFASAVYVQTLRALYIPFMFDTPRLVRQLYCINGATASGNVNMGLYDAALNRLVEIGSTAQAGTNAPQYFNITDTVVGPGLVYLAVVMDNTTGTMFRIGGFANPYARTMGAFAQTLGTIPLPNPPTPNAWASNFLPYVGMVLGRMT